jgi:hypothetical protein
MHISGIGVSLGLSEGPQIYSSNDLAQHRRFFNLRRSVIFGNVRKIDGCAKMSEWHSHVLLKLFHRVFRGTDFWKSFVDTG